MQDREGIAVIKGSRFGLTDNDDSKMIVRFDMDYHDAQAVIEVLKDASVVFGNVPLGSVKMSVYEEVLKSRNEALSELRQLRKEYAELDNHSRMRGEQVKALKNAVQSARNIMEQVFASIARDLVIENTHRGRNELYRAIARVLDGWLKINHEHDELDELPF